MSRLRFSIMVASSALFFASCGEKKAAAPALSSIEARASAPAVAAATESAREIEAGCAGCVYHMDGAKGCQLAVLLDGRHYYVSGVEMPGHESGLCGGPQRAMIQGKVEGERFVATSFAVKP